MRELGVFGLTRELQGEPRPGPGPGVRLGRAGVGAGDLAED